MVPTGCALYQFVLQSVQDILLDLFRLFIERLNLHYQQLIVSIYYSIETLQ